MSNATETTYEAGTVLRLDDPESLEAAGLDVEAWMSLAADCGRRVPDIYRHADGGLMVGGGSSASRGNVPLTSRTNVAQCLAQAALVKLLVTDPEVADEIRELPTLAPRPKAEQGSSAEDVAAKAADLF